MKVERVVIHRLAEKMIRFAAIEHRLRSGNLQEATAELLGLYSSGHTANVIAIYPYGKVEERTRMAVKVGDEESEGILDYLGDYVLGDWHSHPDATPTASKDDKEALLIDYPDGAIMLITAVWPRKRGGYTYKHKAYGSHEGKVYKIHNVIF